MYPSIDNLGNTTTTNFSFNTNTPPNPDNNNHISTIIDHSTNPNFSSFHFIHSPNLFYEEDLHEYLYHQEQQQQQQEHNFIVAHQETTVNAMESFGGSGLVKMYPFGADRDALCNKSSSSKQIPKKRTSKKDRHSKINTAHGPRDRRMRLSLDVAQKFFGLQDMLGFDKASKTVHWLLTKSKTAIKQLTNSTTSGASNTVSASSTSNTSECEVLSEIISDESSLSLPREVTTISKVKPGLAREKKPPTSKNTRGSRAFHPLAKETRERARARARERTVEKRIKLGNVNYNNNQVNKSPCIEGMDQTLNRDLRSWSPFEASGGEESNTQTHVLSDHPFFLQNNYREPASQSTTRQHKQDNVSSTHDHSNMFNASATWSASPFSSYHHNATTSHENLFAEFQHISKLWDHQAYNN